MVQPGQYLERPALVAAEGATLEALYHRGSRPPALLLCPPLRGPGMDEPLLAEIAWAAARDGRASLRFQHRGRGASQGTFDPGRAVEDALSALAHLRETAGPLVAVVGLSTGCATAIEVAERAGLRRMVLVDPDAVPVVPPAVAALVLLPEAGARVGADAGAEAVAAGNGRVEVVAGADAGFTVGIARAAALAVGWISGKREEVLAFNR
jgi:hypothetical protein